MAKHTQTIRRQFAEELFDCFWPSSNFYFCQGNCRKSDFAGSDSSQAIISQDWRKLYLITILRDVSAVALLKTDPGTLPRLK